MDYQPISDHSSPASLRHVPDSYDEYLKQKSQIDSHSNTDFQHRLLKVGIKIITFVPGLFLVLVVLYQRIFLGIQDQEVLMGIWKSYRNIVYTIFVGMFVLLGLAKMLMTSQEYETKFKRLNSVLVVSLLFTTFSYAIAGFLFDLYTLFTLAISQ